MPELTDISVIRALCEKYDFALSKGFGQNFIINPGIPTKIVDASGVDKRYGVIESGAGIGVLTKELAKRAANTASSGSDAAPETAMRSAAGSHCWQANTVWMASRSSSKPELFGRYPAAP